MERAEKGPLVERMVEGNVLKRKQPATVYGHQIRIPRKTILYALIDANAESQFGEDVPLTAALRLAAPSQGQRVLEFITQRNLTLFETSHAILDSDQLGKAVMQDFLICGECDGFVNQQQGVVVLFRSDASVLRLIDDDKKPGTSQMLLPDMFLRMSSMHKV